MKEELQRYLDMYLVETSNVYAGSGLYKRAAVYEADYSEESIDSYIDKHKNDKKFQKLLFKFIDKKQSFFNKRYIITPSSHFNSILL